MVFGVSIPDKHEGMINQNVLSPGTADDAKHIVIAADEANRHAFEQEMALSEATNNFKEASEYRASLAMKVEQVSGTKPPMRDCGPEDLKVVVGQLTRAHEAAAGALEKKKVAAAKLELA